MPSAPSSKGFANQSDQDLTTYSFKFRSETSTTSEVLLLLHLHLQAPKHERDIFTPLLFIINLTLQLTNNFEQPPQNQDYP